MSISGKPPSVFCISTAGPVFGERHHGPCSRRAWSRSRTSLPGPFTWQRPETSLVDSRLLPDEGFFLRAAGRPLGDRPGADMGPRHRPLLRTSRTFRCGCRYWRLCQGLMVVCWSAWGDGGSPSRADQSHTRQAGPHQQTVQNRNVAILARGRLGPVITIPYPPFKASLNVNWLRPGEASGPRGRPVRCGA